MLALLLAPASAMAQQGTPAALRAGAGVSPLERVLQHRADLALTPAQVQKLEAIRQASAEQERVLWAKIVEARGVAMGVPLRTQAATPADRQALRARMVAARPHMNELRQIHLRQMQEARAVLTADQNARAWVGTAPCGGMGPGARAGRGGRGTMRGTTRGQGAGLGPCAGW